jgi:hypothetical protein
MSGDHTALTRITTWLVLASVVSTGAAPIAACAGGKSSPSECRTARACCCQPAPERASCCCQPEQEAPTPAPSTGEDPARSIVWLLASDAGSQTVADAVQSPGGLGGLSPAGPPPAPRSVQALFCIWQV